MSDSPPAPLAACPFCGAFGARLQHAGQTHFVHCPACGAYGPACADQPAVPAVERWNQRNGLLPSSQDKGRAAADAMHLANLLACTTFLNN